MYALMTEKDDCVWVEMDMYMIVICICMTTWYMTHMIKDIWISILMVHATDT